MLFNALDGMYAKDKTLSKQLMNISALLTLTEKLGVSKIGGIAYAGRS